MITLTSLSWEADADTAFPCRQAVKKTIMAININYGRTSVPNSEFKNITKSVLADAETMPSDYEKLKYVHDWLVNNTAYTITGAAYETEADGPVVYGKALCE